MFCQCGRGRQPWHLADRKIHSVRGLGAQVACQRSVFSADWLQWVRLWKELLGHQPPAALATDQTDAACCATPPGAQRTLEKALCIDRDVEAARAQRSSEGDHRAQKGDRAAGSPQGLPLFAWQLDDLVESRVVPQQRRCRGFYQPAEVSLRKQLAQCRYQARGHHHVTERRQSDDQDARCCIGRCRHRDLFTRRGRTACDASGCRYLGAPAVRHACRLQRCALGP